MNRRCVAFVCGEGRAGKLDWQWAGVGNEGFVPLIAEHKLLLNALLQLELP